MQIQLVKHPDLVTNELTKEDGIGAGEPARINGKVDRVHLIKLGRFPNVAQGPKLREHHALGTTGTPQIPLPHNLLPVRRMLQFDPRHHPPERGIVRTTRIQFGIGIRRQRKRNRPIPVGPLAFGKQLGIPPIRVILKGAGYQHPSTGMRSSPPQRFKRTKPLSPWLTHHNTGRGFTSNLLLVLRGQRLDHRSVGEPNHPRPLLPTTGLFDQSWQH